MRSPDGSTQYYQNDYQTHCQARHDQHHALVLSTRLVGRTRDVQEIVHLLRDESARLVTVLGAPGVGKTHLAIHVAHEVKDNFPDGVRVISLGSLGVSAGDEICLFDAFRDQLRDRRVLLLLDNCEHVRSAASCIASLLVDCPRLVILATSRVPLHVRAERKIHIRPLGTPRQDMTTNQRRSIHHRAVSSAEQSLEDLLELSSVALFVERAQTVQPMFALTASNMATVAAICQALDGLPHAIELAAMRLGTLPLQTLAQLVTQQRLRVLQTKTVDLPARQRSLRSSLEWSYHLLTPDEQVVFRRMAVFDEGATLEAVRDVCGCATEEDDQTKLYDQVSALIESNLVYWSDSQQFLGASDELALNTNRQRDAPRLWMLETIREYAWDQLALSGERLAVLDRYARHLLVHHETEPTRGPHPLCNCHHPLCYAKGNATINA